MPTADDPEQRVPSQVAHIARDPLDPRFDDRAFLTALARKQTTIKRALLDQTLISGIGNIYADEALWAARVHYDQPTATLSRARATTLLAEVRLVLGKALAEGGTSFDAQYVNVNGASGYFSHSLNAYGQAGRAVPALRSPDRARELHEPRLALLRVLPAGAGRRAAQGTRGLLTPCPPNPRSSERRPSEPPHFWRRHGRRRRARRPG